VIWFESGLENVVKTYAQSYDAACEMTHLNFASSFIYKYASEIQKHLS